MENSQAINVEEIFTDLIGNFKGILSWQWDDRFKTILAQFEIAEKETIENVLNRFMNISWNSENLSEAPEAIQNIISCLGGLMPEQLLLSSNPDKDALLYCAWWPWGNGQTISIRVAPSINNVGENEKNELLETLKKLVS